ncbi:helix-turn-helix domain-containing protein [Archangium gephyra]|uniref:DNA binding HTH domain-containing protein n=1 Tax=Archangium gephyra TaxID=48 RepID=A0AAC8TG70_9BACT|nr:helix-turn-helix domain-containing protein [Archangium gephyra]AKJ04768.1 Hypothetical protein AA314_06394 [Archangium gephyra]
MSTLEELEREYILAVLARNGGNRTRTAKELGIGRCSPYSVGERGGRASLMGRSSSGAPPRQGRWPGLGWRVSAGDESVLRRPGVRFLESLKP